MLCRTSCRTLYSSITATTGVAAALASSSSSSSVATTSFNITSRRWCSATAGDAAGKDAAAAAANGNKKADGEGNKKDWPDVEAMQEELAKLKAELKKRAEEAEEFKRQALYAAAEANNARRIAAEDVAKAKSYGITSFAKDMLDVNDTLERALEAFGKLDPSEVKFLTEHKLFSQLVTGVKLSHGQMLHNMGRHGIELIEANVGDKFDPNRHDAIFNAPESENAKEGQLAAVVKKGYMLKDRVLRASQVGVAQKQS